MQSPDHRRHDPSVELEAGSHRPTHEIPERVDRILASLGADDDCTIIDREEHDTAPIAAVHDPAMVRYLAQAWEELRAARAAAPESPEVFPDTMLHAALRAGMGPAREPASPMGRLGYWCFETATPLVEGSYAAARAAADVAVTATEHVLGGTTFAYGLCRPPGHHAARAAFGGYCFFNNAAIAAQRALDLGASRVAILDVDYHHGNGTQQIFYERADVLVVSLHADPMRAYPYFTGHGDESGHGRGLGTNVNIPLPAGCEDSAYLRALAPALEAIVRFVPALLVVSLGVDTFHADPLGDLALSREGFERTGDAVGALGLPTVVVQEGGYAIEELGENVRAWLRACARAMAPAT